MEFHDPANRYRVGRAGDLVALMRPPYAGDVMSREEALLLAAWLIVMVDPAEGDFEAALDTVLAT
jgi:hypothetical protein